MLLGPGPERKLPKQSAQLVQVSAERFTRDSLAMESWARKAKQCVDFFEGKQWTAEDLMTLEAEGRPALTLNKIKPLINIVLGYFLQNRTDAKFLPGHDGTGSNETANALTHLDKQTSEITQLPYLDAEVALDGFLTGRGYYDQRLSFQENDFGEVKITVPDPFSTYIDCDADGYDPQTWNHFFRSTMISLDEIEATYSKAVRELLSPFFGTGSFNGMPSNVFEGTEEITPFRTFGGGNSEYGENNFTLENMFDWVDPYRKTIRLIDQQHIVRVMQPSFIDLDTGDRAPIPGGWDEQRVQIAVDWAAQNGRSLMVQNRLEKRVRWTQMVGDIIVFDDWSPYENFTITPFFPYMRRGKTRGVVEDLIDPQREINTRRSARQNIIMRSANGGWLFEKGTLDPLQQQNVRNFGSSAGVMIEWDSKQGSKNKPEQIQPARTPESVRQLELDSEDDLTKISGINESTQGNLDRVQSGAAIEKRQKQSVIGMESMITNFSRTNELAARRRLEIYQNHYTEHRIVRIKGPNGSLEQSFVNELDPTTGAILNDITVGKFTVSIDETPLSATFKEAQFEEAVRLREIGVPIPDDIVIDLSSFGRKEEIKQRMAEAPPPLDKDGNPVGVPGASAPGGTPSGGAVSIPG